MSGLYIHFPFCKSKCIYCNFYSVVAIQQKNAYLDALYKEIELTKDYLLDSHISTIYFGGGTPSLLSLSELRAILSLLTSRYSVSADAEITLEANPEQLDETFVKGLLSEGINRLSIGVQSFSDDILEKIKRRHTANRAIQALNTVFEAGFENVSLDLIYGIPYRTRKQWNNELIRAFSFPIKHLSAYSLTVEPTTLLDLKLKRGQFLPMSESLEEQDYNELINKSIYFDFDHYEISNFAKKGFVSRHNFAYWEGLPYLGLGPSAHSFNGSSRQWNPADIQHYIANIEKGQREQEKEILSNEMRFNEYVMLMLRTNKGISLEHIKKQYGTVYSTLVANNFIRVNPAFYTQPEQYRYVLTSEGMRFADKIVVDLLV